jgi:hypothetical protein
MSACIQSLCVVLCVGKVLRQADPLSKELWRLCIGLRSLKSSQDPYKRAVEPFIIIMIIIIKCRYT